MVIMCWAVKLLGDTLDLEDPDWEGCDSCSVGWDAGVQ